MPRASRWAAPALFLLLLAGFAAGIWGSYRAVFPGQGLYRVTGVLEARSGEAMILVKHDAVPGLMDEMTSMTFMAESRELLDRAGVLPGDRIRLTVRQLPDRLLVVEIRKLR
ncbi:MAG: copper-binding protein [Candidatus Rokubacteria bacterium]|nr:copper-binding protein [Candidatus Rokubacteria bacterium]